MRRSPLILAGVAGASGVAAGAFGAHALRDSLSPDLLEVFDTAARYHLVHAAALLAVAALPGRFATAAAWCFAGGIVLFSGSLYALALTDERRLGAVTPVGGVAFIAGWLCLLGSAWRGGPR